MFLYEYELGKASDTLIRDLFRLGRGESIAITADTESDLRVANSVARSAFSVGARPLVITMPAPLGVGQAADPMLAIGPLTAALSEADAWVEFNNQWLFYSTPYLEAMRRNAKLRYMCLVGMNADSFVRCIGRVRHPELKEFLREFASLLTHAEDVRITTSAGMDLQFRNGPAETHPIIVRDGYAHNPGPHMLSGQIGWVPVLDSIHGTLVFDGSLVPPCGKLEQPISLDVRNGKIEAVEGGSQAREFEEWMDSFGHNQMRRIAHGAFGFNPGARLTGGIVEDERVWGCVEWGIGHVGAHLLPPDGIAGPSHTDGICMNASVWFDEEQVMDSGTLLDERLSQLARTARKPID